MEETTQTRDPEPKTMFVAKEPTLEKSVGTDGPIKPVVELGIEFIAGILVFLYPFGAEQMNLPHNFWLGLGCWIVGTAIAVRMLWIFLSWNKRWSPVAKGAIAFIAVVALVWCAYEPVKTAYLKQHEGEIRTAPPNPSPAPAVPQGSVINQTATGSTCSNFVVGSFSYVQCKAGEKKNAKDKPYRP